MAESVFKTKRAREWGDLALGFPALLSFLIVMPLLFFVRNRERSLEHVYRAEAEEAFSNNDEQRGVILFDRLVRLRPTDGDRFRLAMWLRETGQTDRSNAILNQIAPSDDRGYGPAHFWFAKQIMDAPEVTTDAVILSINHLLNARATERASGEVDMMLAKCYWATGSHKEALEALRDAAVRNPKYYHDLFTTCQQINFLPAASTAAKLSADYLKPIVTNTPRDRESRRNLVEAMVWLKDYKSAEQALRQGMKLDPEGEWHKTLSEVYLAQFRQTKAEGLGVYDLLGFLEQAIKADPKSPHALAELTDFALEGGSDRIDAILEGVLTSGRHTAIVHFVLGSRQMQRGESGLLHMKQAYQLDNNLVFAANNLAYQEILTEDGDLESGLQLITDVLQKFPNSHAFRETRGQLLTRMQRYEEALSDLEYALAKFPEDQKLHESLSRCYQELGQPSLADRHAEKARRIRDRLSD